MRIAISSDEAVGVARTLAQALERRGHQVLRHGALALGQAEPPPAGEASPREDRPESGRAEQWAWASEAAARDVAEGRAGRAVVCCWTGTGASIAANKVQGVRAALCQDAPTAAGARRWNDANALAISLRVTSEAALEEMLDAFLGTEPSERAEDRANVEHLAALERRRA